MEGKPTFFKTPDDFRKWLEKHHEKEDELWVGYYKVNSGKPSITWPQSVDQALCYGWIDGLRKSIDEVSYKIRFTPRRPNSIWSAVNVNKIKELKEQGLMKPAGLAAFAKLEEKKSAIYSFERKTAKLPKEFQDKLKANKKAWDFFRSQAPSYRKAANHWIISAKQEATKLRRLDSLIADSENGKRVKPLRRPGE